MKKILLIDDDKDLVRNLQQVFTSNNYAVAHAHRAADGLRTVLSFRPDVIILDVMLETDTGGFEFVYQLRDKRENSRYKEHMNTPIVLLTGINQATNFRFSLNEQASFLPETSAIFTKPAPIEALLAKVRELT